MSDVMIEAKGLGKTYGEATALQNASFELRRGEILGFLGPNGAGKSTTMKILTCFIAPTSGSARVNGCDIWEDPLGVRRSIGYLPESTPLYGDMLVFEYLEWVAQMRGMTGDTARRRLFAVIEEVALGNVLGKAIRELSKGYKQRVGLAQALVHEPPILILDEPMSGLDPNQAVEIRNLIREIGKERTIILSTHNLAEVQVTCARVLIIDRGRIVADDTPEALTQSVSGPRYRLTVLSDERLGDASANGSPEDVFRGLPGVDAVRVMSRKGGELKLEITSVGKEDLRALLYRSAVDASLVLVGLETKGENLEQVFANLTVDRDTSGDVEDDDLDEDEDDLDDEEDDDDEDDEDEDDDTSDKSEEE